VYLSSSGAILVIALIFWLDVDLVNTSAPSALGPLLERHCSIQAYSFSKPRGACRVDAYTLNTGSIPKSGEIGLQYLDIHGVCNMVFPVTMATYNYSEAPELPGDDFPADPANSVASFDTSDEHVLRF
jgi:hypothetical protein